jgi:hypothetical protein
VWQVHVLRWARFSDTFVRNEVHFNVGFSKRHLGSLVALLTKAISVYTTSDAPSFGPGSPEGKLESTLKAPHEGQHGAESHPMAQRMLVDVKADKADAQKQLEAKRADGEQAKKKELTVQDAEALRIGISDSFGFEAPVEARGTIGSDRRCSTSDGRTRDDTGGCVLQEAIRANEPSRFTCMDGMHSSHVYPLSKPLPTHAWVHETEVTDCLLAQGLDICIGVCIGFAGSE